jgi:TM2 domain-containing membrane protein YozV
MDDDGGGEGAGSEATTEMPAGPPVEPTTEMPFGPPGYGQGAHAPPPAGGYGHPPPGYGSPPPYGGPPTSVPPGYGYGQPGYGYGPPAYGPGPYWPPGYGPAVVPKNPALSVLVSVFVPGVGSMINGDVGKGVGILVGYSLSLVFSIVLIGLPFLVGFWLWGVIDAYQGAQLWNARRGIVS